MEALSYGIPVISTDQGAISSIVDENVGMAISDLNEIDTSLTFLVEKYISKQVSIKCRDKYLKNIAHKSLKKILLKFYKMFS